MFFLFFILIALFLFRFIFPFSYLFDIHLFFIFFNYFFFYRSEVTYSNKKLSSSTFQRFHCLTLDLSYQMIPDTTVTPTDNNSSNNKIGYDATSDYYPPLKTTETKTPLRTYSAYTESGPKGPGTVGGKNKMTLDVALEKYFQLEVSFSPHKLHSTLFFIFLCKIIFICTFL